MPSAFLHWRIPPLFLGLILCAYWGRVVRMAYKLRRRKNDSVDILPRESLGRFLRIIWTPVILVWIAQPFVVAIAPHPPILLRSFFYSNWIAWPALLVAAGCFMLTRICWRAMGRNWRMAINPMEENPLLSSGPFRVVRHPIYSLSILLMLSTMAMIPTPLMLACGCIHIALLIWESRREERHMMNIHGQLYADYRAKVGAFIPRPSASA